MYLKNRYCYLVLSILLNITFVLSSSETVPVFIWKETDAKGKSFDYNSGDTGKLMPNEFGKILNKELSGQKKILVFLQDALSEEDFSDYTEKDTPYKSLRDKLNSVDHLYFPAVSQTDKGLAHFQKKFKSFHELADNQEDIVKHLNKPGAVMVYVHLPKTAEGEYRAGSLEKNDEMISNIITAARMSINELAVIFTAEHPSVVVKRDAHSSRHLLAVPETGSESAAPMTGIVSYNSTCVLLFIGKISVRGKNGTKEYLPVPDVTSACENASDTSVSLKWTGTSYGDVQLVMKFKGTSKKGWSVSSIQAETQAESSIPYKTKELFAPGGFSYSCGGPFYLSGLQNATTFKLGFENLQMQPLFGKASNGFGRAYDCVGFFTAPILAGVLVSLMFAAIMYWALAMVMGIQTMDQFDDPKGPSISVPQTD